MGSGSAAPRPCCAVRLRGTLRWGVAVGRRRIEDVFDRFRRNAPDLFARNDVSLHSYRHALGTFIDGRYGRPITRAVLGHTSRRSPTDHYVHIPVEQVIEALTTYEAHVLGDLDQRPPTDGR
jgi:hypothetical protein